jgi:hypothetical protein
MRYCEGQFLEVAQRHGLCRPSSSVLNLKDILDLNASVVRVLRAPDPLKIPLCLPHHLSTSSGLQCFPVCLKAAGWMLY